MGVAAILVVFALGRRLGAAAGRIRNRRDPEPASGLASIRAGDGVGLLAALAVAVYPPFIHSTGELMSEPAAILTLPAAVLAFLWAADARQSAPARGTHPEGGGPAGEVYVLDPPPPRHPRARWLLPGLLFGVTAMIRPEYLFVGIAFIGLAAARVWLAEGWRPGLVAAVLFAVAMALPIVPWTIRNVDVLDRVVPISTGSGKALYVGTFLPADGEYQRVKAILVERYQGRTLDPHSEALEQVDPTPLFDRVAARYPDLPRDSALGKIGKENFSTYFEEDPLGYLGMTARKVGRMWSSGIGAAMSSDAGRALQILLVVLGLAGAVLLGLRRRWWELAALATPIVLVTAIGAASLAAPRRNEVLMTLVFPLAALTLSRAVAAISSGRQWSPQQASSPPN